MNTSIRFLADQAMRRAIIGWPPSSDGAGEALQSAACRLLSASMRKLPLTTTLVALRLRR